MRCSLCRPNTLLLSMNFSLMLSVRSLREQYFINETRIILSIISKSSPILEENSVSLSASASNIGIKSGSVIVATLSPVRVTYIIHTITMNRMDNPLKRTLLNFSFSTRKQIITVSKSAKEHIFEKTGQMFIIVRI